MKVTSVKDLEKMSLEQLCEYARSTNGVVFSPKEALKSDVLSRCTSIFLTKMAADGRFKEPSAKTPAIIKPGKKAKGTMTEAEAQKQMEESESEIFPRCGYCGTAITDGTRAVSTHGNNKNMCRICIAKFPSLVAEPTTNPKEENKMKTTKTAAKKTAAKKAVAPKTAAKKAIGTVTQKKAVVAEKKPATLKEALATRGNVAKGAGVKVAKVTSEKDAAGFRAGSKTSQIFLALHKEVSGAALKEIRPNAVTVVHGMQKAKDDSVAIHAVVKYNEDKDTYKLVSYVNPEGKTINVH